MFKFGCFIINMGNDNWQNQLSLMIDDVWQTADDLRPKLLEAASFQLQLADSAYHQLFRMFETMKQTRLSEITA